MTVSNKGMFVRWTAQTRSAGAGLECQETVGALDLFQALACY